MDKLIWCCKQKRGIELVGPKEHLSESYASESEQDLKEIENSGEKWKVVVAYYSCYEALYSILMKCGIKSEIHDCSFELMPLLGFSDEDKTFMVNLKQVRKENQYYLKKNKFEQEKEVQEFVLKCKEISNRLDSQEIKEIREKIQDAIK